MTSSAAQAARRFGRVRFIFVMRSFVDLRTLAAGFPPCAEETVAWKAPESDQMPVHSVGGNVHLDRSFMRAAGHGEETEGEDQMRRMREGAQEGPPSSGGEREAQRTAPKRFGARSGGRTADMAKFVGEADFFLIPLEEDGLTTGPWARGMSTQDRQSPHTWSLLFTPGVCGVSPMGRQGPSSHRPFWANSSAICPCGPRHRTMSFPGSAVTARHTDMQVTVHLVQNLIIDDLLQVTINEAQANSVHILRHCSHGNPQGPASILFRRRRPAHYAQFLSRGCPGNGCAL